MKVLVLGGTGAIGAYVVKRLAAKQVNTTITSRKSHKNPNEYIKYIKGNALDLNFLKELLNIKWDAIIDFLVYENEDFKFKKQLFLEATSHYIYLSSARVYSHCNSNLKETSIRLLDSSSDLYFLQQNEYCLLKARQENYLYDTKGENFTIIRPYITYSKTRLQLGVLEKEEWLFRAIKGRSIVFSSEMLQKITTLTHGFDVGNIIADIVTNTATYGNEYHVTTNETILWIDVLNIYINTIKNRLGFEPKIVLLDDIEKFIEIHPRRYQVIYDRLYNRSFDNSKIVDIIGNYEFQKVTEGLEKAMTEFLDNPTFGSINWKNEALKDRICKEYTPLKQISGKKNKIKYIIVRHMYRFVNNGFFKYINRILITY